MPNAIPQFRGAVGPLYKMTFQKSPTTFGGRLECIIFPPDGRGHLYISGQAITFSGHPILFFFPDTCWPWAEMPPFMYVNIHAWLKLRTEPVGDSWAASCIIFGAVFFFFFLGVKFIFV